MTGIYERMICSNVKRWRVRRMRSCKVLRLKRHNGCWLMKKMNKGIIKINAWVFLRRGTPLHVSMGEEHLHKVFLLLMLFSSPHCVWWLELPLSHDHRTLQCPILWLYYPNYRGLYLLLLRGNRTLQESLGPIRLIGLLMWVCPLYGVLIPSHVWWYMMDFWVPSLFWTPGRSLLPFYLI